MTIKEIYEWAKRNGVEDYEAVVKYRDGGESITEKIQKPIVV